MIRLWVARVLAVLGAIAVIVGVVLVGGWQWALVAGGVLAVIAGLVAVPVPPP